MDLLLQRLVQGGGGGGNPPLTPTTTASIELINGSVTNMAPAGFNWRINPASLSGFTESPDDLDYFWDAYSTGSTNTNAPVFDKPVNIYDGDLLHTNGHRNSRFGYGLNFSHAYQEAGTYELTCLVVNEDASTVAFATTTVTVTAPSYAGTNTVYMSPSGSFSDGDVPTGALTVTSGDVDAVLAANIAGSEATPKRLILRRGENYTFSGYTFGSAPLPSVLITAGSGAGARPVVTMTGSTGWDWNDGAATVAKEITLKGLNVTSGTDFTLPRSSAVHTTPPFFTTNSAPPFFRLQGDGTTPEMLLIDDCLISNVLYLTLPIGTCNGGGMLFFNSSMQNYESGFNAYDQDSLGIMGCFVGAGPGVYEDNTDNAGWALRTGMIEVCIQSSDFFTKQDWFDGPPHNGQANLRLNADQDTGVRANVQTTVLEGGFSIANNKTSGVPGTGSTVLQIEKTGFIGTYRTTSMYHAESTGNKLKSCYFIMPRSTTRKADPYTFAQFDSASGNVMIGCSLFNLNSLDQFEAGGGQMLEYTGTATVENNAFHQPNTPTGQFTADGPFSVTDTGYLAPREEGRLDRLGDDRANTVTLWTAAEFSLAFPTPLSGVYQDVATGRIPYRDLTGRVRGANPSRGAFEPV